MTREAVEEGVLSSLRREAGLPEGTTTDAEALAATVKSIAYHEAGHAAVAGVMGPLFLGQIRRIVGRPDRYGGPRVEIGELAARPAACPANRPWFRAQAMVCLAGTVAECRADGTSLERLREIVARIDDRAVEKMEHDRRRGASCTTDWAEASRCADMTRSRSWPRRRVLETALEWTADLVAVPEVWAAVGAGAAELAEKGELGPLDAARIFGHLTGAFADGDHALRWSRRLCLPLLFVPEGQTREGMLREAMEGLQSFEPERNSL